jgi:hypothetical protein
MLRLERRDHLDKDSLAAQMQKPTPLQTPARAMTSRTGSAPLDLEDVSRDCCVCVAIVSAYHPWHVRLPGSWSLAGTFAAADVAANPSVQGALLAQSFQFSRTTDGTAGWPWAG